ncbi:hypothetical protein GGX14DRAFT_647683 [Mycena pura]|uniref:Uncharacterized protein n=1 Tax=Mycena pura TaxID=153505 RepID=A0AAD6V7B0_9AGAR|nr:hypothetical protein GGX14DRAFT_647683 [Mycena pura]
MAHRDSGLPSELERIVFKLAALDRPSSIPTLIRVAWRVKQWVEPLLYRTLVINDSPIDGIPSCDMDTFRRIAETKSPDFLADAVRNVMIGPTPISQLQTILSACRGIQNLYFSGHVFVQRTTIDILPLRHLYCWLRSVFDLCGRSVCTRFAHLTHLYLRDDPWHGDAAQVAATLTQIPNLTHFAMNRTPHPAFYSQILDACTHLRVLVVLPGEVWGVEEYPVLSDVRLVKMWPQSYKTDWKLGISTGDDFWARAEAIVADRISGEVEGLFPSP